MRIFSPSSRQDYSFCPRYWWLRKQGWTTHRVGYPELCGMGGTAISEAMCLWNTRRKDLMAVTIEELVAAGLQSLVEQQAAYTEVNRSVTGLQDLEFRDTLPTLVETGIRTLWDHHSLKDYTIVAAEHEFTQFGNARADVIVKDTEGVLIVDYKCKFGKFDEKWLDKEFDKHFDGEQRMAYTFAAGCDRFAIVLCAIQPTKNYKAGKPYVQMRVSRVLPVERKVWLNDVGMDYQAMEVILTKQHGLAVPGKAAPHKNDYGDCVYKEACLEMGLEPQQMMGRYLQLKGANASPRNESQGVREGG